MTEETAVARSRKLWGSIAIFASVLFLLFLPPARNLAARFFASLRIPKPQAVSLDVSASAGANGNRTLQQIISQMVSSNTSVTENEPDETATNADAATRLAGYPVQLPAARKDPPKIEVFGAHAVDMVVDRGKFQTILEEAGRRDFVLPGELDGAVVTLRTLRSIRAQYGNCPVPPSTIQGQIQGPPPPSAENGDCLVLTESPTTIVNAPPGLDLRQLVEIGLELSGMSPNQSQLFLKNVEWKSALTLAMPRFLRSFEIVQINGAQGVLVNLQGRRGPSYFLIWVHTGMTYSLTGYSSATDAAGLANTIR